MVKGISNALLVSKLKFSKNESFFKKYFFRTLFYFSMFGSGLENKLKNIF